MSSTYNITFSNNIKALLPIGFWAIPLILGCIFLATNTKSVVIIILATSLLWGFVLFIHLEYLKLNWGAEFKVDKGKETLTYSDEKKEINIHFDEINRIVKYQPPNMAFLRDAYFYYEIFLKNQEKIIITCLLVRELKIPGIDIVKATNPIPSIYLSKDKAV